MTEPVVLRPPRKWLGRKGGLLIVALGTVLWLGTVVFEVTVNRVNEAPTNALFIGGFTVASAFIYTMAYRLRPSDGLTVNRLLVAFLVGGILATTFAAPTTCGLAALTARRHLRPSHSPEWWKSSSRS
jgi:hypothetical protein